MDYTNIEERMKKTINVYEENLAEIRPAEYPCHSPPSGISHTGNGRWSPLSATAPCGCGCNNASGRCAGYPHMPVRSYRPSSAPGRFPHPE